MPSEEIGELSSRIARELNPIAIYVFGSCAAGTQRPDSDVDLYVVLPNDEQDLASASTRAYRSIRGIRKRPVDVVVGTQSRFEERAGIPSVEHEVHEKGVLVYG